MSIKSTFKDIADAIREKTGKTDTMKPTEMADEISSISGGGGGKPNGTIFEVEYTNGNKYYVCLDFDSITSLESYYSLNVANIKDNSGDIKFTNFQYNSSTYDFIYSNAIYCATPCESSYDDSIDCYTVLSYDGSNYEQFKEYSSFREGDTYKLVPYVLSIEGETIFVSPEFTIINIDSDGNIAMKGQASYIVNKSEYLSPDYNSSALLYKDKYFIHRKYDASMITYDDYIDTNTNEYELLELKYEFKAGGKSTTLQYYFEGSTILGHTLGRAAVDKSLQDYYTTSGYYAFGFIDTNNMKAYVFTDYVGDPYGEYGEVRSVVDSTHDVDWISVIGNWGNNLELYELPLINDGSRYVVDDSGLY